MSGPFKLRSGNTTPFKKMGSSPVKQNGDEESMRTVGVIPKAKEYYKKVKDYLKGLKVEKEKIRERNMVRAKADKKYKKDTTK